jgi:hypothetical protein
MRRVGFLPILALFVFAACSNPSGGAAGPVERDAVLTSVKDSSSWVIGNFSSWAVVTNGSTVSAAGPNASVVVAYSPGIDTWQTAPAGQESLVVHLANHYDSWTGYRISGTFTCRLRLSSGVATIMSFSGSNLTAIGKDQLLVSLDVTMDVATGLPTGTITINGQTYVY